jgi:hypothetical protein
MIITATHAIYALSVIKTGREDYVNNRNGEGICSYVRDNKPDCGVGCALAYWGVTVEQLKAMDNAYPTGISGVELPSGFTLTSDARTVFAEFQSLQDNGVAWGEAFIYAQHAYNELRG